MVSRVPDRVFWFAAFESVEVFESGAVFVKPSNSDNNNEKDYSCYYEVKNFNSPTL